MSEQESGTKFQIENRLLFNLLIVSFVVIAAWIFGSFGVSCGWILLFLLLVMVIWRSTFFSLVTEAVQAERDRWRRKRALQNMSESCEWLNLLINRWWQTSSQTIFNSMKDTLDPIFYESKPSFVESIELKYFCVGESTPYVKSVRAYDFHSSYDRKKSEFYDCLSERPTLTQVALELDVVLCSNDFKMIFKTRLGGRAFGVDLDASVETLNFRGKAFLIADMDPSIPFPHIPKFSITFMKKPDVWFSIRILKSVQMMEVPGLKSWIHSLFMSTLTAVLVDPGKLDIHIHPQRSEISSDQTSNSIKAIGVLKATIQVALQGKGAVCVPANEDSRWCALRLGEQNHRTGFISNHADWKDCCSFIVSSLTDCLSLKVKSKRIMSQVTLFEHNIPLSDYDLENEKQAELILQKKNVFISNLNMKTPLPPLSIKLEYTSLIPILNVGLNTSLDADSENSQHTKTTDRNENSESKADLSGVMYVCVHSAQLFHTELEKEGEIPDPYCLIFNGKEKVRTTHYMANSFNPSWESEVEFLTTNYTQASLTFFVCNWNGDGYTYDTNMIGFSSVNINQGQNCIYKEKFPLIQYAGCETIGNVVVSINFRNVPSIWQSELSKTNSISNITSKHRSKKKKIFLRNRDDLLSTDITNLVSQGSGVMELVVICACDLVAKDLNGFSDPYCEIKIDDDVVFKTSVKKKTLFPQWNESVTIKLPTKDETFTIIVWDWDAIGRRDFVGDLILTLDEIQVHSLKEAPEWFSLQNTKSGSIKLQMRIVMESHNTKGDTRPSHQFYDSLPNLETSPRDRLGLLLDQGVKSENIADDESSNVEMQSTCTEKEYESINLQDRNSSGKCLSPLKKATSISHLMPKETRESQESFSITRSLSTSQSVNNCSNQLDIYQNIKGTISNIECSKLMPGKYYCKVKIIKNKQNSSKALRVTKSNLFAFIDNKSSGLKLDFQINVFKKLNQDALLVIEMFSEAKEIASAVSITLFELFDGAMENKEVKTQLQLTPNGTINISICHGRPTQSSMLKSGSRILKSLSFH